MRYPICGQCAVAGNWVGEYSLDFYNIVFLNTSFPVRYILPVTPLENSRSHATTPLLPPPTPPAFSLDFAHLLQATTAMPAIRGRPRANLRHDGSLRSPSTPTGDREYDVYSPQRRNQIIEEEGWEFVDEDADSVGFG